MDAQWSDTELEPIFELRGREFQRKSAKIIYSSFAHTICSIGTLVTQLLSKDIIKQQGRILWMNGVKTLLRELWLLCMHRIFSDKEREKEEIQNLEKFLASNFSFSFFFLISWVFGSACVHLD